MPTLTLVPVGRRQYLDADGEPLALGKVWFYESGTSSPLSVYTEHLGITAHPNPVELDSNGCATIYLLPRAYREVVKDVNGVTISTTDPVHALQPSSSVNLEVDGTAGEALSPNDVCYLSDGSGGATAGRWYKADQDLAGYAVVLTELAFSTSALAVGDSGIFRRGGALDGFSGLIAGQRYFISATAGALTSTPTNWARGVGVAISSTLLLIQFSPNWTDRALPNEQTTEAVGNQDDFYLLTAHPVVFLRCNNATTLTLRGFQSPLGGRMIHLVSIGAGGVILANEHASSVAANRIITGTGGDLSIGGGRVTLIYDDTSDRWRVMSVVVLVPGTDTMVLFNDGGALGADSGMVYNKATNALQLLGACAAVSFSALTIAGTDGIFAGNLSGVNILASGVLAGLSATFGGDAPATPDINTAYRDTIVKAWASVTNSGSPTLADDFNVASLTDNGVGDVSVNFATALASANYVAIPAVIGVTDPAYILSRSTTVVRVQTGAPADLNFVVICVGG